MSTLRQAEAGPTSVGEPGTAESSSLAGEESRQDGVGGGEPRTCPVARTATENDVGNTIDILEMWDWSI
jgi:hypothetical protein